MTRPRDAGNRGIVPSVVSTMRTRRIATVTVTAVTALMLSGCGSTTAGTATVNPSAAMTTTTPVAVPTTTTRVAEESLPDLVKRALTHIDAFWEGELGRDIGATIVPFNSAAGDRPTCDGDEVEVAGYCPATTKEDTIAWDSSELDRIRDEGGDLSVALVMAHEYGHAVEDDMGQPPRGVTAERRAWCLSGAYMATNEIDYSGDWDAAVRAAKPEGAEDPDQFEARRAAIEAGQSMPSPSGCLSYSP